MTHKGKADMVVIGLGPGELLLESIMAAAKKQNIRNGIILSGIGTLKTCRMYYIKHTNFPPARQSFVVRGALELVSVNGLIADGEPHFHVVVSRGESSLYAGHLEERSEVCYLAEIAILRSNGLQMARRLDPQRKINLLGPRRTRSPRQARS
jgi:predicted DNA-binding protein with PD1-like motif